MSRFPRTPQGTKKVTLRQTTGLSRLLGGALLMGLFALVGAGGVIGVHQLTEARIVQNQRADALKAIHHLLPATSFDNDLLAQPHHFNIRRNGRPALPVTAYLAQRDNQAVATLLRMTTPDGYNGEIQLLLAVRGNGTLIGVEVIEHRETPGLGDRIESERSDWLRQFDGASLANPRQAEWKVKRDGGRFDQLTGATITPRAVVRAVREALDYLRHHRIAWQIRPDAPSGEASVRTNPGFG
jgi:Na+-translocating ferredoxin:NAD+ oxidoreductase subunit G